jgi:hypothetical protein
MKNDPMLVFSYVIGWALVFAITPPSVKVIKHRFDERNLPAWLCGDRGRRLAFLAGLVTFLSAASLLVCGEINLKWYIFVIGWFMGLVISGFIQKVISPANLIGLGTPFLIVVNVVLWIM